MKYGESTFDILYLLFAVIAGCIILRRARNTTEKQMRTMYRRGGMAQLSVLCG